MIFKDKTNIHRRTNIKVAIEVMMGLSKMDIDKTIKEKVTYTQIKIIGDKDMSQKGQQRKRKESIMMT
jgi:hypothetical protein